VEWNPVANFTIASASNDATIKVWDVHNEEAVLTNNIVAHPWDMEWNEDGSLLGALTKD